MLLILEGKAYLSLTLKFFLEQKLALNFFELRLQCFCALLLLLISK